MIEKFISFSIRYKILIITLFIAIALLGYNSYKKIPIDAFPDITPKQVVIYTESPGNSPQDIEKMITYPIESALAGMAGVRTIISNSIFGLSYVSVFFEDRYDIYFLRQLVSERLQNIDIPKGWGKPVIGPNTTGLGQVFWYRLNDTTKSYSLSWLKELHQYRVIPLLKSISGVEEVINWGGFDKQYEIAIDTNKLQTYKLTYKEVVEAIQRANRVAGGQYLEFNKEQYIIRYAALYKTVEDIEKTPIKRFGKNIITVEDIATVKISKAPRFGAVTYNGQESVFGMVLQRSGTNAAKVVERIKEKLSLINKALPKGVQIEPLYDRSQITKKAVKTMTSALLSGMVLVTVVLFLFLFELRSALIVILSLPLSLAIAFLFMDYFKLSANLMSLSGLAIAVGMIVDATIVIVENSFRKLHETKEAKEKAIIEATKEVAVPVIFAVLIIITAFTPLILIGGLAGKLYAPMALNIIFVMIGSLLVALALVPVLNTLFLKPTRSGESFLIKALKRLYEPLLTFILSHAKSALFVITLLFAFLSYKISSQGTEFMPKLNEESIMYRVIAIPGTALSQSIQASKEIEQFLLKKYPSQVTSVLAMIGRSEKGETAQTNYMEILLILKENVDTQKLSSKMTKLLGQKFPYLQFIPTQPIAMRIEELLEGIKAELAIKIFGEDQKILESLAKKISQTLQPIQGLEEIELESQLGQAQIVFTPNYSALKRYNISIEEIGQIIRHAFGKDPISQKIEGIKRFGIVATLGNKKDLFSLKHIPLTTKDHEVVTLGDVCNINIIQGASFIKREDLSRYLVLSLNVEGRDIGSFVKEASSAIKKIDFPDGYYIRWAGDFKNMQETTQKMLFIVPVTIFIAILLIYLAFNSISKAFLIFSNVPLALIGSMIAILITDIYISVSAIVGFLAIFAIAILNGIVLVSFIDTIKEKYPHVKIDTIIKDASLLRLRPVLMTASTTLFGILPLLFSKGVGAEIQYPLAVVVTGGIISSTLLTLLILPAGYKIFYTKSS